MRKCEACKENIKETDKIIRTNDDKIYHEECCYISIQLYSVFVDGDYVGNTEQSFLYAGWFLRENEYEEDYDEEYEEEVGE